MNKTLTILGSTGSIGTQALEVAGHLNIKIKALCANANIDLLEKQIHKFAPETVALYDEKAANKLQKRIGSAKTRILQGIEGQLEAARESGADIIVTAIAGQAGLEPTVAVIEGRALDDSS